MAEELNYLDAGEGKKRLIVAGIYLEDGSIAFVDRDNSELLITDTNTKTYSTIDLNSLVPLEYRSPKPSPSDVNTGLEKGTLLVTYSLQHRSLAILCKLNRNQAGQICAESPSTIPIDGRTRSVVVLNQHFVATLPDNVIVIDANGKRLGVKKRVRPDRGGLLMSDKSSLFFYGDINEFVCCQWSNNEIQELFRFKHPQMQFPRGSCLDSKGNIIVACDESHNIIRVSPLGKFGGVVLANRSKAFGDIDICPSGTRFFTSFWHQNEWPIVYNYTA